MTPTEHPAKTPSAKIGFFATLRGLSRGRGSGAPAGVRPAGLGIALLLTSALLALSAAPAQATVTHEFLPAPSAALSEGVPAASGAPLTGPLSGVESMTIDSGHLWLAEKVEGTQNSRVDKFDPATGEFVSQFAHSENNSPLYFGIAVGHLAGEPEPQVYLAEFEAGLSTLGVYGESGTKQATWTGAETPVGSFGRIAALAVDNSTSLGDWAAGDLYAPDLSNGAVYVFHPEADGEEHYVTQLPEPEPEGVPVPFNQPRRVAVSDLNGDVFVADGNLIDVFEPTLPGEYAFVRQLTETPAGPFGGILAVAVDGGAGEHGGEIYVAQTEEGGVAAVDQFSSAGVFQGRLTETPSGPFALPRSVAVDPSTHRLYVGDRSGVASTVDVFGPPLVIPDVTVTEPPTDLTPFGVTLHGTVKGNENSPVRGTEIPHPS